MVRGVMYLMTRPSRPTGVTHSFTSPQPSLTCVAYDQLHHGGHTDGALHLPHTDLAGEDEEGTEDEVGGEEGSEDDSWGL